MRTNISTLAVVIALVLSGMAVVATVPAATADNDDSHRDDHSEFVIEDVEAPESAVVGETVTLNVTITNVGPEGMDSVEVGLSNLADSDIQVSETREIHLARNETTTIRVNLSTDGLESGSYRAFASTSDDSHDPIITLIDLGKINASPVCVDHEDDTATFGISNDNEHDVYVTYEVNGSDVDGSEFISNDDEVFITVPTDEDGNVNVTVFYRGADEHQFLHVKLETVASNPSQTCGEMERQWSEENITLTADCHDPVDNKARFTLSNDNDVALTFQVTGSFSSFNVAVEANSQETFTIGTTDDGSGLARVHWSGGVRNDTRLIAAEKANTTVRCDLGEPNEGDAYQFDLDFGEVISDLGEDEGSFYNSDGSLIQARNFHESGSATHSYNTPGVDEHARASAANATLEYGAISFDPDSGQATVEVSLSVDADESITLTFAAYELPDGTFVYQQDRADEQVLLDHVTIELEPGESMTLTVDTDS